MGIGPNVWGPHVWHALHYISLGYPTKPTEEQKRDYKQFFLLLQTVLPCSICAEHYKENLKQAPLTDEVLANRDNFIRWVIELHNTVNEMKGKGRMDEEEAILLIKSNSTCHETNGINYTFILLIVLSVLIGIAIIYKKI